MHLVLVGLNHKSASVDLREKLYFHESSLLDAYKKLSSRSSIAGCVIVSTCNRIEIYAASSDINSAFDEIETFIEAFHSIPKIDFLRHIYKKHCEEAVSHLFKVVASLDSMVVGEYQIQGQLRDAYSFSSGHGFTNNLLNKIFQTTTQVGKVIRSETEIGKGAVSIASVAVDLVRKIINEHSLKRIMIIGAGKMASLAASGLSELRACKIVICNRTGEKALDLAKSVQAENIHYSDRYNAIAESDIVIVSTGADHYVVTESEMKKIVEYQNSTKYLIDISVPRNIDPEIKKIAGIQLFSVDDLKDIIDRNIDKRLGEVAKAEQIIADISGDYYEWYAKQEILPIMHHIKKELDVLKSRTFDANKEILSHFDESQKNDIVYLIDNYSEKLIKAIMKNMRNIAGKEELQRMVQSLQQSFNLDEE